MQLSDRARNLPASPIRKLVPLADEAKRRGIQVFHLNIGQPDIPTPEAFFTQIREKTPKVIAYSNSDGVAGTLTGFMHYYQQLGFPLSNQELMVTTGGSEALLFAIVGTCNPGDEIITFEPFYTNYNGFSQMVEAKIRPINTTAETGYHLPPRDVIEKQISDKTKAILICNPNNPTGCVYSESEVRMLAELCRVHKLWLFSDEVYREFAYDGEKPFSVLNLSEISQQTLVVDSLSKRYSLCGARVGALVSRNQELIRAAVRMGQARLSAPLLGQLGAEPLFYLPEDYYHGIVKEYQKRRDILYNWIKKIPGAQCKMPKGAFYTFVTLPITDSDHFASWLLTDFHDQQQTVMIAPGGGFYAGQGKGANEVRIAYVLKEEDLNRAMELLAKALAVYRN